MTIEQTSIGAFPACSECGLAWVLRRSMTVDMSSGTGVFAEKWVWQRDCKHKKAPPEIVEASDDDTGKDA